MASRANKEARPEPPSYGAPMGPPAVSSEEQRRRDRERREKLESKPTAEEREKLIEEHEERAIEESEKLAQERKDKKTAAPKPSPYTRIGETTGKPPTQIIAERPEDVGRAIDIAEGVEPLEVEEVEAEEPKPRVPPRRIKPPKQK